MIRRYIQNLQYSIIYAIQRFRWKFMGQLPYGNSAQALGRPEFINVTTRSYWHVPRYDPKGAHHLLPPDAAPSELGRAIRDSLSKTRYLTKNESSFFRKSLPEKNHIKDLMKRYKIKSQRALLEGAAYCTIDMNEDVITVHPWAFSKIYYWDRGNDHIRDDDLVTLPADCSDEELGQGLRLAFSRCWPKTPWVKELMAEFEDAK